ncbi:hypothetical protein THAPSDRAFT_262956, partial [Thalassiosira pseudonana CCMP1335]
ESELLARIGKFLPTLQFASNGTARVRRLVKNMVVQLGGCRETNKVEMKVLFGSGVSLNGLGKAIGTALRILVTIDTAVASNADLQEAWAMYKDVVMEWSEQKREDNTLDEEFESFERMMVQLDFSLLSSRSFVSAIEQNFDPRGRFHAAKFKLYEEIHSIVISLYGQYCEQVNTETETTERLDCVGVYAMYVLYRQLLPPNVIPDAKLHKSIWGVFPAMCPILELFGPLYFMPREFIMLHAPYERVKGCSADIAEIRSGSAALVLKWDGSFKARVSKIRLDALGWLAVADSELSPTVPDSRSQHTDENDDLDLATSCILRGMKIAHSASILLRGQLVSHRGLGLDIEPDQISSLLALMEVLKSIEKLLRVRRRTAVLAFQRSTLKMIAAVSNRVVLDLLNLIIILDITACLSALEGVLKGTSSFSPIRRYSISFSIAACMDSTIMQIFNAEDLMAIKGHLADLSEVASIEEILHQACDCSCMYFYRDLFPVFIENLYQTILNSSFGHTQLVLSALSDPERILKHASHLEIDELSGSTKSSIGYKNYLFGVVQEEYIDPICEVVEIDLRLTVHAKNDQRQKAQTTSTRVHTFINAPPLYICQKKIDVKAEVEKYLEKTFYNLCTLSLNDCNTYTEMRSIANERYGLCVMDPYLPDGNLEQSVNFIDILRDLNSFVSKYNYNMIDQSFVECRPVLGAKFLFTFNTKCVSASMKQHGNGIVGSAINASYNLLGKKFQLFTQFMADENVKSLLSKEFRWLNNQKNECSNIYPFSRASAFAQELKKFELESGNTGLDECRNVLSEIGNIIAFVRMIRAAKRKIFGDEMAFLSPSVTVEEISNAEERYDKSSAQLGLDETISSIIQTQDTDFIRAFVNVFKGVLQHQEDLLGSFFCMVPALCLCWMDASIQGKEMMHKKNISRNGYFTDDGFAVGLAFCLSVLEQNKQYECLNWFKSIQNKYADDEEDLIERENAEEVKRSAMEMTALKMMRMRLESNRREMAVLFFSMHGAAGFF